MKKLREPNLNLPIGLDVVRIISGAIIFTFGLEIFSVSQIDGYSEWLTKVGMPLPRVMAYVGKFSELFCGFCLAIGYFTRLSAIPLIITMCVINFIMLEGKVHSQPFYLLLIFMVFFFAGSGRYSLDALLHKRRKQ